MVFLQEEHKVVVTVGPLVYRNWSKLLHETNDVVAMGLVGSGRIIGDWATLTEAAVTQVFIFLSCLANESMQN